MFNLANETNIDGVVCSPHELKLTGDLLEDKIKITPGIRLSDASPDDQSRVMNPKEAIDLEHIGLVALEDQLHCKKIKHLLLRKYISQFMNNRHLKKLNSLKKHSTLSFFIKDLNSYLNISSTYHHYSKDVFNIMDEIYQELCRLFNM